MIAVKRRCLPIGKRILIHRKRSPFPPLGKVNGIRDFNKNRLKYGDSGVLYPKPSNYAVTNNQPFAFLTFPCEGRGTAAAVDE